MNRVQKKSGCRVAALSILVSAAITTLIITETKRTALTRRAEKLQQQNALPKNHPVTLPQENALWTQSLFFRGFQPSTKKELVPSDIEYLADHAVRSNITALYIFSGPFNGDGTLPPYPFSETARASIAELKKRAPNLKILPWIGGLQDKTVFFNSPQWSEKAVISVKKLIDELGVPGVHLDFEYVLPTSDYVLYNSNMTKDRSAEDAYHRNMATFFSALRKAVPTAFLSGVFHSSAPDVVPWKKRPSPEELPELTKNLDQVAMPFYDTSIKDRSIFQKNMREQLLQMRAVKEKLKGHPIQFLLGIGTFVNEVQLHSFRDLTIEGAEQAIPMLRHLVLTDPSVAGAVDGIAIYCDWQTDDAEWAMIEKEWAQYQPPHEPQKINAK